MDEFKQRLLDYIKKRYGDMSQRGFEEMCGISQGTIASIRVKGPSVDVLMKISNTCPDLNMNWLIVGRGEMIVQDTPPAPRQNDIHHNQQVVIANWDDLKDIITEVIKTQTK